MRLAVADTRFFLSVGLWSPPLKQARWMSSLWW